MFLPFVKIRIQTNPNRKIVKLCIGDPYMYVNRVAKEVDPGRGTKPQILNNRTMLPVRAIIEELGGKVDWNADERNVSINICNKEILLWISSKRIVTNHIPEETDIAAVTINSRTMLPIRYVTECISHTDVDWDAAARTVTITYNY